jgi:hypothetical protein
MHGTNCYINDEVISMLEFIAVEGGGGALLNTKNNGITFGTNCVPLLVDLNLTHFHDRTISQRGEGWVHID